MLVIVTLAWAEPLVHHEADPETAVSAARAVGVIGPLSPVSLTDVRKAEPTLRAGGVVLGTCEAGPPDVDAVRGHLLYGELDEAALRLDRERRRCDGFDRRAALERTAGILAQLRGDAATAAAAFASAKGFDPNIVWDEGFPVEQRGAFDAAQPALAQLKVVPAGGLVDGAPSRGEVAVGVHGVVIGGVGLAIEVVGGDELLSVPAAYPEKIRPLADEADRRDLSLVLTAAFNEGERVSVWAPDGLWTGAAGRVDWTLVAPIAPATADVDRAPRAPRTTRSPAPWVVAGGGALLAGVGYTIAGLSAGEAHRLNEELSQPLDAATYAARRDEAGAVNGRVWLGQGVGGVGVGAMVFGLGWGVMR
jgi:hypothetical protein